MVIAAGKIQSVPSILSCGTRPLGDAARSTGCLSSAGKQEARLRDRSLSLLGFVA
jgi:hypothetical protein